MTELENSQNETIKIYTFSEVAEMLQVGRTTMYKIMKSKHPIPFVSIGTVKRIDAETLQKWLRDNSGRRLFR